MPSNKKFRNSFIFLTINAIPKRVRILISTLSMVLLLLASTFSDFTGTWHIWTVAIISVAYLLTYVSVFEGVDDAEWLTLFIMPVLFSISMYHFYTLLFPIRWLTRIPFLLLYSFGFYALLLSSNIFNVGVEKSIQLYRAAFSVNFLIQTSLIFLTSQVVFSLKQGFLLNGFAIFFITFPLITQLNWTVNPNEVYDKTLLRYSYLVSILMLEITLLISFIPLKTTIQSLLLTATYYSLSGITYHHIDHKLFRQAVREYVFVIAFVTIIALLTIQW